MGNTCESNSAVTSDEFAEGNFQSPEEIGLLEDVSRYSQPLERVENDVSQLQWVNHALKHLWPEMEEIATYIAETKLLPMMNERAPKKNITRIGFSNFTLGKMPVIIGPVSSTNLPEGATRIRINTNYVSDMFMELEVETHVGTFQVGMRDFQIQGILVIIIRPFINEFPGTGGASVCFIEAPRINFTFSGIAKFANFPGMKDMVIDLMGKVLADTIVSPHVLTVLMNFKEMTVYPPIMETPAPIGVLHVTLQIASTLKEPQERSQSPNNKSGILTEGSTASTSSAAMTVKKSKGVRSKISSSLSKASEVAEHYVGKVAGVNTDPYLKLALGGTTWDTGLKTQNVAHTFTVFDMEQKLYVGLWDRDLVTSDDQMGNVGPFTLDEATTSSGKLLNIIGCEDETHGMIIGKVQFRFEWNLAERVQLKDTSKASSCLVIARARELYGEASVREKELAFSARLGNEVKTTAKATLMKDVKKEKVSHKVAEIREALRRAGVSDAIIEEACRLEVEQTRMSINRSLFFTVDRKLLSTSTLELSLVELPPKQKHKKDFGHAKRDAHAEPKVLGEQFIPLSGLKCEEKTDEVEHLICTGDFGEILLEIDIDMLTLTPTADTADGDFEDPLGSCNIRPVSPAKVPIHKTGMFKRALGGGKHILGCASLPHTRKA